MDPKQRITVDGIRANAWFSQPFGEPWASTLSRIRRDNEDLIQHVRERRLDMVCHTCFTWLRAAWLPPAARPSWAHLHCRSYSGLLHEAATSIQSRLGPAVQDKVKSRNVALRKLIDEACTKGGGVSSSFASKPLRPLEQVMLSHALLHAAGRAPADPAGLLHGPDSHAGHRLPALRLS